MIAPTKKAKKRLRVWPRRAILGRWHYVQRRQWWLWASAIIVTLALTAGMVSFSLLFKQAPPQYSFNLDQSVRGLVGLVFLFDLYTIFNQFQIYQMQRKLHERDEMFRLITENAGDLISVVDADGSSLYHSPAHQRTLGYSDAELQHVSAIELVHPEDRERVREAIHSVRETGVAHRMDYRTRHKNGRWRTMESTVSVVRNGHEELERLVIVNRDVTERREAEEALHQREEQLRQAQKMEAVGRLSGGIAHDFNNLLGVIIGYSEVIGMNLPADDPVRKNAEQIRVAGQRAAGLTRQLLAFSRQQMLQLTALDLNTVVLDLGKMLKPLIGADIELTTELEPHLGWVRADQGQLEQVIMNLAVNARDAMPEGGKLVIQTSNAEFAAGHSENGQTVPAGSYVLLTVRDTGVGMDADTQSHIFEPFYTGKARGKGTGLGLSTVYGIVRQSNGFILVHSQPAHGTTFQIYLPHVHKAANAAPPATAPTEAATGSETILVVEDEEALRTLISDQLARGGYEVLSAQDGHQALALAGEFKDRIHMLLTDVVMPGISGPALARKLAVSRPEMSVLFMSGYPDREIAPGGKLPSDAEFLQKPFGPDTLIRKVRRALDVLQVQDLS
jgi:PAS domain S-box-containing protein